MSEVKRKKNESFEAFMRRVKQTWQRSGKILQAKKVQFYDPPKSKNLRKKQAVMLSQKYSKRQYLQKVGRLPAEQKTEKRRSR